MCIPCGSLSANYVQAMNKSKQISKQEVSLKVLRLLEDDPKLSQRDIADRLGVSLGSVNYCLKALIEKGWVKVNNFRRSDNKMGYAYILTPRGVSEHLIQTKDFLKRKLEEYDQLRTEIKVLEAELISKNQFSDNSSKERM